MDKTVLIVEDNKLNMKLFQDLMEAHQIGTIATYHGGNVMELVAEHHPDLILMDIMVPEIDGSELIRMLKADDQFKAIPIIAVTAMANPGDEQKIRDSGCEDYIAKPIQLASFMERVQYYLNDAPQSDAGEDATAAQQEAS